MAYDASKEKHVNIGQVAKNKRGDFIKVQRIIPLVSGKLESIDVRNMYTSIEDGNLYPARQGGIRMNSEIVVEVMKLIYKAMSIEERMDFRNVIDEIDEEEGDTSDGEYDDMPEDDDIEEWLNVHIK